MRRLQHPQLELLKRISVTMSSGSYTLALSCSTCQAFIREVFQQLNNSTNEIGDPVRETTCWVLFGTEIGRNGLKLKRLTLSKASSFSSPSRDSTSVYTSCVDNDGEIEVPKANVGSESRRTTGYSSLAVRSPNFIDWDTSTRKDVVQSWLEVINEFAD